MASLIARIVDGLRYICSGKTEDLGAHTPGSFPAVVNSTATAVPQVSNVTSVAIQIDETDGQLTAIHVNEASLQRLSPEQGLSLVQQIVAATTTGVMNTRQSLEYRADFVRIIDPLSPLCRFGPALAARRQAITAPARDLIAPFRNAGRIPYDRELTPNGDILLYYQSTPQAVAERLRLPSGVVEWRYPLNLLGEGLRVAYHHGRVVPGWEDEALIAERAEKARTAFTTACRSPDRPPDPAPAGRAARKMFPSGGG